MGAVARSQAAEAWAVTDFPYSLADLFAAMQQQQPGWGSGYPQYAIMQHPAFMLAALTPQGQKLVPSRPPQQSQQDQSWPVPTPPGAWAPMPWAVVPNGS